MILLAPLSKEAGGYEWCKDSDGQPARVFSNINAPDYQTTLRAIQAAKVRQERIGRIDMPGWRPPTHYVYWMKRFGLLPQNFDPAKDFFDPYKTDQAYWRSLWYGPPAAEAGSMRVGVSGETGP